MMSYGERGAGVPHSTKQLEHVRRNGISHRTFYVPLETRTEGNETRASFKDLYRGTGKPDWKFKNGHAEWADLNGLMTHCICYSA